MAEPLRDSLEQENRTASIAPLPPALPETRPEDLNEDPFWVGSKGTSTTERVGSAVGEALGTLSSRVRSGLRVVAGKSREASRQAENRIEGLTDSAEDKARELSRDAEIRFDEFRRTAYQRLRQARSAARHAVNERPLESIVAIGAVGLVIGFVLRIWRSNGD